MTEPVFELRDAGIEGPTGRLLHGADLAVREGSTTVLLGPGGVGKSLLLQTLSGRPLPPRWQLHGSWRYRGAELQSLGVLLQCTAETVLVPQRRARGTADPATRGAGWRRALDAGVPTVLLDEPMHGASAEELEQLVVALDRQRRHGSAIVVTHDVSFARRIADEVALLVAGRLTVSEAARFFEDPPSELAERFVRQGNAWPHGPRAPDLPKSFHWILPGRLAGMGRPGLIRTEEEDLEAVAAAGITLLVSLTSRPVPAERLRSYGLTGRHFPIQDMGIPPVGTTARLCGELERALERGEGVALHCHAGLGRTGTVLAALLVWMGEAPDAAISRIRAVSRSYIQNHAQLTFVERFAEHV